MIRRTLKEIADMCGGRRKGQLNNELIAHGVTRDSRDLKEGNLFIPIVGMRVDGHDFVAGALEQGAAGSLWQKDRPVPAGTDESRLIFVNDCIEALQKLAAAYRSELLVRVIGITGSNGKTTTKDMTAAVLGTMYKVHKTEGNYNNEIGLPLTILSADEETEVIVLEMGMSEFGEIELLTKLAQPDAAIITNIGDSHMQQLGSREGIAKAKLEIVHGLSDEGIFIYNGDEPLIEAELRQLQLPEGIRWKTFGFGDSNDWSATAISIDAESTTFTPTYQGVSSELGHVTLPVLGKHNVSNALAAIAAGRYFGVSSENIAVGLAGLRLTSMRVERSLAANGAVLLNDAYNASATSMKAAIDLMAELKGYRRKWLVLGDILEVGPTEQEAHYGVGAYVTPDKADAVFTFGPQSRHIYSGACVNFPKEADGTLVRHFDRKEELIAQLQEELHPKDLVLVKGSRGMRMEQVVQALEAR